MMKTKELIKSPHIHIALVTGICIVILAFVSKRLLPVPISDAENAAPSFIMLLYELFQKRLKGTKAGNSWYWMGAIAGITLLIILVHRSC